jgi:putative hemolysin
MSGIDIIVVMYIISFVIFVLLSAFFSSAETAFISLQRFRLEHMVETKVKGATRVARLIKHPAKLLSTILLANNFVNTAAAALATVVAISLWGEHQGVLYATLITTIILLVFGDATPKTIGTHHAEKLAVTYARFVEILSWILTPFVFVLSWIVSGFTKMISGTPVPRSLVTDDEIRTMISVGHKEGTVEASEAKMLHNVFDFGDSPVNEVMIPRPEVIAIEKGTKIGDYLALFAEHPLSRFPVYAENMDNVVGIISLKDVLMGLAKGTVEKESPIDPLIRPAYFAPATKRINELFAEMQARNYHLAVIVDEYGGTAGIVSLSVLIEEIVGPVGDELAAAGKDYEVINEHTFQIDGSMRIEEVNKEMGLDLPDGNGTYETVAGFILSLLGHIPRAGEQLRYKSLKLVITRMRGMKIEEILVTKEKREADATAAR